LTEFLRCPVFRLFQRNRREAHLGRRVGSGRRTDRDTTAGCSRRRRSTLPPAFSMDSRFKAGRLQVAIRSVDDFASCNVQRDLSNEIYH
jgi:hypothetical protein